MVIHLPTLTLTGPHPAEQSIKTERLSVESLSAAVFLGPSTEKY